MVDSSILNSKWVVPKGGNSWGYKLKPGAPESVKKKFEQYQTALNATRKTVGKKKKK